MPGLLYANDLVLCGASKEELRAMVGFFVEVCRKIGLKVNACKSKAMVLNGEERLECDVCVDSIFQTPTIHKISDSIHNLPITFAKFCI